MKTLESIIDLLRETIPEVNIEPFAVDGIDKDAIVYSYTPLSDDGKVRKDRLEIHIIAKDLDSSFDYDTKVRKVLLTLDDTPLNQYILQSEITGGGALQDAATGIKHLITYYTITSKGSRYYG